MNEWNKPGHTADGPWSDIRLVALDLDGTIFNRQKEISGRTMAVLQRVSQRGIYIVPATGRAASGIPEEFAALASAVYGITANGALVSNLKTGEVVARKYLTRPEAIRIYEILIRYDTIQFVSLDGISYTTDAYRRKIPEYSQSPISPRVKSHPTIEDVGAFIYAQETGIEKFSAYFKYEEERLRAWKECEEQGLEVSSSIAHNMEITAGQVDKRYGLQRLAEYLGLSQNQLMAFGDAQNDRTMIEYAGGGVAMGNAEPEVKKCARYITLTNDEDGVADALEKLIL